MSEKKTSIVVSLQGPKGSGKTLLSEKVLQPVLRACGIEIEKVNDSSKGVFLTLALPADLLGMLSAASPKLYSQAQVEDLVKQVKAEARADGGPCVGLANFDKVRELVETRRELMAYAADDMAGTVVRMALPAALRERMDPDRTIDRLRRDALDALRAIDAELEALGFDLTEQEQG